MLALLCGVAWRTYARKSCIEAPLLDDRGQAVPSGSLASERLIRAFLRYGRLLAITSKKGQEFELLCAISFAVEVPTVGSVVYSSLRAFIK